MTHCEKNIKDRMNKIKGREEFRPFAVMILKEDVQKYFSGSVNSPYMNVAYKTQGITDKKYPGIVHADGTTRLQIVDENPHRQLLEAWKKKTGCPMILNTSLNIKGEPIVNDEYDIKKFTLNTGVEVL